MAGDRPAACASAVGAGTRIVHRFVGHCGVDVSCECGEGGMWRNCGEGCGSTVMGGPWGYSRHGAVAQ